MQFAVPQGMRNLIDHDVRLGRWKGWYHEHNWHSLLEDFGAKLPKLRAHQSVRFRADAALVGAALYEAAITRRHELANGFRIEQGAAFFPVLAVDLQPQ